MKLFEYWLELEDIHFKYERLESLISVLQMYVAEVVDVMGEPAGNLSNALFEIETEMGETNERLKSLFMKKGGVEE